MQTEFELFTDLAPAEEGLAGTEAGARSLEEGLSSLARTLSGPLAAGVRSFAAGQKQLAAVMKATAKAARNQIRGFDELHLVQAEKTAAEKKPSGGSRAPSVSTKALTKALRETADLLRQLSGELVPGVGTAALAALPLLLALAAALSGAFRQPSAALAALAPLLELLAAGWQALTGALAEGWALVGEPVFGALSGAFSALAQSLQGLWGEVLVPIFTGLWQALLTLWETLAPYWQELTEALARFGTLMAGLWASVLLPFLQNLLAVFVPQLQSVGQLITDLIGTAGKLLTDWTAAATDLLTGLCQFLSGIFSGQWKQAWEGILNIFDGVWQAVIGTVRGAVNLVIDLINFLLRAVTGGLNAVVNSINSMGFTVPDWVPFLAGKSFSPNLPHLPQYQIPRLAAGAVLPANRPFLALMGDQRRGTNIEAPLDTIREALAQTLAEMADAPFTASVPVEVSLDGEVLYRAVSRVRAGRGAQIGGAYADCY